MSVVRCPSRWADPWGYIDFLDLECVGRKVIGPVGLQLTVKPVCYCKVLGDPFPTLRREGIGSFADTIGIDGLSEEPPQIERPSKSVVSSRRGDVLDVVHVLVKEDRELTVVQQSR